MENYNLDTIYVLQDPEDGIIRILQEADRVSVWLPEDERVNGTVCNSQLPASEYTVKYLLKLGYEIIQEWN